MKVIQTTFSTVQGGENPEARSKYVPPHMIMHMVSVRRVICISPGESTVSNPFWGNEEEW